MANQNIDIIRVEATAANIPTTLINGQAGFETDNSRWAYKDSGGTMHYYTDASSVSTTDITITDNTANAFRVREGSNNYLHVDSTDSSEHVYFGNTTTNPDYTFYGSGTVTVGGILDVDGINSDGGAFAFNTTGDVSFNQKVGIGTSSPNVVFESSLNSSGSTSEVIRLTNPNTSDNTGARLGFSNTTANALHGYIDVIRTNTGGVNNSRMVFGVHNGSILIDHLIIDENGIINIPNLTASQAVFTDGSKNLVSNAMTGTGDVVMSASPTLTGTTIVSNLTASGTIISDNLTNDSGGIAIEATNTITIDAVGKLYAQISSTNVLELDSVYTWVHNSLLLNGGTANRFLFIDASKVVTYVTGIGTGNVVRSDAPTLTGILSGADGNFSGLLRCSHLAATGRYDAGDGGTTGAHESVNINGIDMVLLDPSSSANGYYDLTDGSYQGQRVSVSNKTTSYVINIEGKIGPSGTATLQLGANGGATLKWDVTDDMWYIVGKYS